MVYIEAIVKRINGVRWPMTRFMICDTDTEFLDKLAAALHNNFDPCSIEYMYGPSALEVSLR